MKKAFSYSFVMMLVFCSFMGNIDVFSYVYINESNQPEVSRMKDEIYMLVEEYYSLLDDDSSSSQFGIYSGSLCPDGITLIDGNGNKQVHDLEEYVAGVVAAENNWHEGSNLENIKAQAVAARTYAVKRTNYCKMPITNGQSAQVYKQTSDPYILQGVGETKDMILTLNGSIFSTEYDAFCVVGKNSNGDYLLKQPSQNHPGQNQVIPKSFVQRMGQFYVNTTSCYGHGRGMSQIGARYLQSIGYTFDEILKYYYPAGLEILTAISYNWSQSDPRWGSIEIGNGKSIASVGCMATSVAILIAKSGVQTSLGADFNPGTFVETIKKAGAFDGASFNHPDAVKSIVPSFQSMGNVKGGIEGLKSVLEQGYYAIAAVNGEGHWVAVDKVVGDDIYIIDPAGGQSNIILSQKYGKADRFIYYSIK